MKLFRLVGAVFSLALTNNALNLNELKHPLGRLGIARKKGFKVRADVPLEIRDQLFDLPDRDRSMGQSKKSA